MEGGNMQNTKGRANDNRNLEQDLTNKGGEINCIKAKDTIWYAGRGKIYTTQRRRRLNET